MCDYFEYIYRKNFNNESPTQINNYKSIFDYKYILNEAAYELFNKTYPDLIKIELYKEILDFAMKENLSKETQQYVNYLLNEIINNN